MPVKRFVFLLNKDPLTFEPERPGKVPRGKITDGFEIPQEPLRPDAYTKKDVEEMIHQEFGGRWGLPRPDAKHRVLQSKGKGKRVIP